MGNGTANLFILASFVANRSVQYKTKTL